MSDLAVRVREVTGLTPVCSRVLAMLFAGRGPVATDLLSREVTRSPDADSLRVRVAQLRAALIKRGLPADVMTVRGLGYDLGPDLRAWLSARIGVPA